MTEENTIIEQEPWTVRLRPAQYQATLEKIEKINARAAKRGFTGKLELNYTREVITGDNGFGLPVEEIFYHCTITGIAPCYNGWRFAARIDVLPGADGVFTIAAAPGVSHIDRSMVRINICDHCNSFRYRKNIYIVENVETGELKQVGSTCIKDFLGWSGSFCFLGWNDISDEFEGYSYWVEPTWTVRTVLAASYLAIKEFGWIPSKDDRTTTKQHMLSIIDPPTPDKNSSWAFQELCRRYREIQKHVDEALDRIPAMIEWVHTLEAGASTFNDNLLAIIDAEEVSYKQLGLLAYVPEGYARSIQRAAEKAEQERAAASQTNAYIGEVGDRITVTGTLKSVRSFPSQFGVTTLYTIATDNGLVKWFASSPALGEDTGVPVTLKGTVKKHEDYNGIRSTVLTRCVEVTA